MELSSEDNFRLNVLLANKPRAIRIDESKLIVYGLSDKGEAKVQLHPNTRPEQYLRTVRELISGHILGSPGGYPVYLRRWTRMGQMRDESLEQLLMLGEPEAVVAAVGSSGLTETLARRAWWAMEDAGNARRMLCNPTIVGSSMGPILADYLIDYLPFETAPETMMESVRLVLQPGLIDGRRRLDLWRKSARKQPYLVGFLKALPDDLPEPLAARADAETRARALKPLLTETPPGTTATGPEAEPPPASNPCARLLLRTDSAGGQTFLATVSAVLAKPPSQEVVTAVFDVLRDYLAPLRPDGDPDLAIEPLIADSHAFTDPSTAPPSVHQVLAVVPEARADIAALRLLSGVGYGLLRPVLRDPTTLGSLMRRKLTPVIEPLQQAIAVLRGEP
jgi:hypothetical protein